MSDSVKQPTRRERLVRAAEILFARKGFHAATVPEIAAEAGVSVGLLYRYFPGKAALAVAIVEADREQTRAAIEQLIAACPDPWTSLTLLIRGWMEGALRDRAACALVPEIAAEAARDPAVREVVLAAEAATVEAVASLVERACPGLPARPTAIWILAALDGLVSRVAVDAAFAPGPSVEALIVTLAVHREGEDEQ